MEDEQFVAPNLGGRPQTIISLEAVSHMRSLRMTWADIGKSFNPPVNKLTLSRWRKRIGFVEPLWDATWDELVNIVREYLRLHPNDGEILTWGFIQSQGFSTNRDRLREVINFIDPLGRQQRKYLKLFRRVYSVPGPHHLWHMDGWHKLIKYGMVVHACIDGFSRCVIYAVCSNNNRSDTVLSYMQEAVVKYGCPSRIRADFGGENVGCAEFIIAARGLDRHSFLAGASTHNQRIERNWRDMRASVGDKYMRLFKSFEDNEGLNILNNESLFLIQYLFIRRINEDLADWIGAWNNHRISSEKGNPTPLQLLYRNKHISAAEEVDPRTFGSSIDDFDVDVDADAIPSVVVIPPRCPLNQEQYERFCGRVQPLRTSDHEDSFLHHLRRGVAILHEIINEIVV